MATEEGLLECLIPATQNKSRLLRYFCGSSVPNFVNFFRLPNFRNHIIILLLITAGVVLMSRCDDAPVEEKEQQPQVKFLNLHDTVKYVGMGTCRQCHNDIYQSYIQTGMGQSFGRATKERSAGNFANHQPIYDKHSDLYYKPFWRGDSLAVMEYRLKGRDTLHKLVRSIDYIIGSGHHTNSHLYSTNGYIYQAPFTYYVQEGKWGLPPGFEDGNNSRFSRAIGLECMSCHNGYPQFDAESQNRYHSVPMGIDCERCHGPGELHVRSKQLGQAVDVKNDTDFTIVNPRKLPFALQIDVCQRCHLQGNAILKEGKDWMDFKPGMHLREVMDVYVPQLENEEQLIMASHLERLKMSPCFIQSNKKSSQTTGLNCITCHNPHLSVQITKREHFNNQCQSCHTVKGDDCTKPLGERLSINNNDCSACHMPRTGTIDIPHVTITDHFITVHNSEKKFTSQSDKPVIKGLRSVNNPNPDDLSKAKAYLFYFEKFSPEPFLLDSAEIILKRLSKKNHPAVWVQYYFLRENYQQIVNMATSWNTMPGMDAMDYYRVGQAYQITGNTASAEKLYRQAIQKKPLDLNIRNKFAALLLGQKKFTEAKEQLEFILNENPYQSVAINNLGFLYLLQDDVNRAQNLFDRALALDPDYQTARLNLAKVELYRQRPGKARALISQVLEKEPQNPHALQLLQLINDD